MSPSKTPKQARAMKAAAAGKSTIGIPKSVGQEYAKADAAKGKSASPPKPKSRKR